MELLEIGYLFSFQRHGFLLTLFKLSGIDILLGNIFGVSGYIRKLFPDFKHFFLTLIIEYFSS